MLGPCIAPEVLHLLKERFVVGQVRPHHNPRKLFRTPKIPHRGKLEDVANGKSGLSMSRL